MNLNQVTIAGKLTRDPELRYTPKGTAIAKLGLAINRTWTNEAGERKEEVTFIDVDTFGKTAENCGQYLRKGSTALITGRLKLDQWDDKASGQKRSKLGVVAEMIQFGSKPTQAAPSTAQPPSASAEPTDGEPKDDVPF